MSNGKAIAPFGGGPAGVLDLAAEVAGGIAPPDPAVTVAARAAAPLLASLPPAQLRDTIEKVIMGKALGAGLQWMHDAGVLGTVLPELDATVDFSQEAGRGTRTSGSTPSRSCCSRCPARSSAGRRCCTTSARCGRG